MKYILSLIVILFLYINTYSKNKDTYKFSCSDSFVLNNIEIYKEYFVINPLSYTLKISRTEIDSIKLFGMFPKHYYKDVYKAIDSNILCLEMNKDFVIKYDKKYISDVLIKKDIKNILFLNILKPIIIKNITYSFYSLRYENYYVRIIVMYDNMNRKVVCQYTNSSIR